MGTRGDDTAMIAWLFDNPKRLQTVAAGLIVSIIIMTIFLLLLGTGGGEKMAPGPTPSTVRHTELIPPTSPTPTVEPTPYVQPSQPIALEAVSAWLRYDLEDFGVVASPAALDAVSEAPRPVPGQKILGSSVELGGPDRQTVQVVITGGTLELIMVKDGERWVVQSMRYVA